MSIKKELKEAIEIIAHKTTPTEFDKIKQVMFGLYSGCTFGLPEQGIEFLITMDSEYKKARSKTLKSTILRVVK